MPARLVERPPRGHLNVADLHARWGGVFTRQAITQWFRKDQLAGRQYLGGEFVARGTPGAMWCCAKAEAARWESVHPRLRERKGGAA